MAHEWVDYVASDADVKQQTNDVLYHYDLRQLRDLQGWMTDNLIHYGVAEYNPPAANLTQPTLWIQPSLVKLAKDGSDEAFRDGLGQTLSGAGIPKENWSDGKVWDKKFGKVKAILFPVNRLDTHWSLLVYYQGQFHHYDSLGSNKQAAKDLIKKLKEHGYLATEPDPKTPHGIELQQDGYNCGLYVVQYSRLWISKRGKTPSVDERRGVTSQSCDQFRAQLMNYLQPLFPAPPPAAQAPPPLQAKKKKDSDQRPAKKVKKRGKDDVILKKHWWVGTKFGTKKKRRDKIRTAILLDSKNDRCFAKCFTRTSPTALTGVRGEGEGVSLMNVVEEARALRNAIGGTTLVPSPFFSSDKMKSWPCKPCLYQRVFKKNERMRVPKYCTFKEKGGNAFTFAPDLQPLLDDRMVDDRNHNVWPDITPEGWQPTFSQFQRQEMNTILRHCKDKVPDHNHNHQHVARSLILAMAMANFYLMRGQPRFLPGDTRSDEMQKEDFRGGKNLWKPTLDKLGEWRADALENMPVPEPNEVDPATIMYAVAFHDSGRKGSGADKWEHESARNAFYYLKDLGYGNPYAAYVAGIIVKEMDEDENKDIPKEKEKGSKGNGKFDPDKWAKKLVAGSTVPKVSRHASKDAGKGPKNKLSATLAKCEKRKMDLNAQIAHDADVLEIQRISRIKFDKKFLKFLTDTEFEKIKLEKGENKGDLQKQLIDDAKLFIDLTKPYAKSDYKGNLDALGYAHFEKVLDKFSDFEGYFEAHESCLIESIVTDPKAFPFLYLFYFRECFDPKDEEFLRLDARERLALVRIRLATLWSRDRDATLAHEEEETYNKEHNADLDLNAFAAELSKLDITINLKATKDGATPADLDQNGYPRELSDFEQIMAETRNKKPNHAQQLWEVFYKTGKLRTGASLDFGVRDMAERRKLQYQDPHTTEKFEKDLRALRPKYAAIDLTKTSTGACPKYGSMVYILKPHVWRRATLTHNDTFNDMVFPDDICTPDNPYTLLMGIWRTVGTQRLDPYVVKLYLAGKAADGAKKDDSSKKGSGNRESEELAKARREVEDLKVKLGSAKASEAKQIEDELVKAMGKVDELEKAEKEAEEKNLDKLKKIRLGVQKGDATPYLEVHIHGPVEWARDIEEIRIETSVTRKNYGNHVGLFDQRVQQFAALWDSKEHPEGIPVRFVSRKHYGVFETRADAEGNKNAVSSKPKYKVLSGRLSEPKKMEKPEQRSKGKPQTKSKKPKDKPQEKPEEEQLI